MHNFCLLESALVFQPLGHLIEDVLRLPQLLSDGVVHPVTAYPSELLELHAEALGFSGVSQDDFFRWWCVVVLHTPLLADTAPNFSDTAKK